MIEKIYFEIEEDFWCETRYVNGIFDNLRERLVGDYSIVITSNLYSLPITKYKKIVILTGDELGNLGMNPYVNQDVAAVFRIFNDNSRFDEKYVYPIPPGYNWTMHSDKTKKMNRMYSEKKLSERKYDIFYSGQPLPWRQTLVNILNNLSDKFNILCKVNNSFRSGIDIDEYYKIMGETKIAVAPDGTAPDSFRFVEALGSGCIVVVTNKDDVWYYRNSPVVWIESWNQFDEEFVNKLLSMNIDDIYQKNLDFYKNNLSEEAVANYILECINKKP